MSDVNTTEWKLPELAAAAGVSTRTVRYYVQRGLLPSPEFRGPDTAYERHHLLRLRAIRKLQQAHLPLDEIQRLLDASDDAGLERLAAEGVALVGPEPEGTPQIGGTAPAPSRAGEVPGAVAWRRWALAPGVELHVADDAGDGARALVEQILAMTQAGGSR